MSIQLTDSFVLDGVRKTADGYVAAFAKVARTGIQEYKGYELGRPDLDNVRVYRPPEEVFNADAMRSFAHRPVTLKHPAVPVSAKNWKKFAGGQTGENVVRDGEFIRVPMVMMDSALIDAYEKGGVKELSMGYSTDIQWRTGVTDAGETYDAVQTEIRGNHLAVVPRARGGDQLRIGDEDSSSYGDEDCPECGAQMHDGKCPECGYTTDGEPTMFKPMIVDGIKVSVADDQSVSIIERHIAKLMSDAENFEENFKKKDEEKKKVDDALAEAKKNIETKDGEIAVLKKQVEDAKITPDKLDVMVKDRLEVIDSATKFLGDKFDFTGKTVQDIRRATVASRLGDELSKTMPEAAIDGAFAAMCADAANTKSGTRPIADALRGRTNVVNARDEAWNAANLAMENAWRTPKAQ